MNELKDYILIMLLAFSLIDTKLIDQITVFINYYIIYTFVYLGFTKDLTFVTCLFTHAIIYYYILYHVVMTTYNFINKINSKLL